MAYVLIENGVVIQKQPNEELGFIEASSDVICGMLFDGTNYTIPPVPVEVVMARIRAKRDNLLAETDWWGASDQTMTDAQTAYRLALRNYPATYTADDTAAWPTKP